MPPKATKHVHDPGKICDTCRQEKRARQQDEIAVQLQREQEPIHALVPQHQQVVPPVKEQGEKPQAKTRSGRETKRPSHLMYSSDFNQHETRETTPKFRMPGPRPQKPKQQDDEGSGTEV